MDDMVFHLLDLVNDLEAHESYQKITVMHNKKSKNPEKISLLITELLSKC